MITFNRVQISYGDNILLKNASFHVKQYEKAVIIGRSGSGKSTLLNALAGFSPFKGDIYFGTLKVTAATRRRIRQQLVYIGQEPILAAPTVKEAIDLPFSYKANQHLSYTDDELMQFLDAFFLPKTILDQQEAKLSGGEKQRIAIIRALLMKKKYMLADEITSALDSESKKIIMDVLWKQPDLTVLSVSHDQTWIDACHPVFHMENKQVIREDI